MAHWDPSVAQGSAAEKRTEQNPGRTTLQSMCRLPRAPEWLDVNSCLFTGFLSYKNLMGISSLFHQEISTAIKGQGPEALC